MEIALADVETSSENYASRFVGSAGAFLLGVQTEYLLKLIQKNSGKSVLDVGGGHAQTAIPLSEAGYNVTVIGSTDICKTRLPSSIPFKAGNLLSLPFDAESFDSTICFRFISHCDDWKKLIHELCRVTRHSVIIDYPTARSINFLTSLFFGFKKQLEGNTRPYTIFRDKEIIDAFRENGFELKERWGQFFFPMVIHRVINNQSISRAIETLAKILGLHYFASPVIARFGRTKFS